MGSHILYDRFQLDPLICRILQRPHTRSELQTALEAQGLAIPRSPLFDHLNRLGRIGAVYCYPEVNPRKRGRPRVFWRRQ